MDTATTTGSNIKLCPKFSPLVDPEVKEVVEPSGRSSGKTTSNEIVAVALMTQSGKNNIWYCRAEAGDIRSTIFSSMISTIGLMGLDKYFGTSLSPYQIRCVVTGATCYFSGINGKTDDDTTATKGFTPETRTLMMCILDEADQVKHPNHIAAYESTAKRWLLKGAKMVYAYNPPMQRTHWAHKFFNDKIKAGASRIYTTWEDVTGLLNERSIEDILKFKREDPEYYKYWYLGIPIILTGLVYPQFSREKHCLHVFEYLEENKRDAVVEVDIGVDEGTVNDSTCATALAIMRSGITIVLDFIEIDPLVDGQKSTTEVTRILTNFVTAMIAKFPFIRYAKREWIFECAEGGQLLKLQFEEFTGEYCTLVTNKSVLGDVKRVRTMLSEGLLMFNVGENVGTEILITDIENYMFDEKNGGIKKNQRDDSIDSLEYATKKYFNRPIERM